MTTTRDLRSRTLKSALRLERFLGIPRQGKSLPRPLNMLVATILSQNTNDRNSHRAYTNLRKSFPSWEKLAEAPVRSIASAIRSGGMANQKSARIKQTIMHVKHRYGRYSLSPLRRMSSDAVIEDLTSLNGVGTKTAACVLLFSLGRDVFPVDTHVHRICTRLGLANGSKNPVDTFQQMKPLVPPGRAYSFHTNLIRFGRLVCRSSDPLCGSCPLTDLCTYKAKRPDKTMNPKSQRNVEFMLLDNVRA